MDTVDNILIYGTIGTFLITIGLLAYFIRRAEMRRYKPQHQIGEVLIFNHKIGKRKSVFMYKIISINLHNLTYTLQCDDDNKGCIDAHELECEFVDNFFKTMTKLETVLFKIKK